MGVRSFAARHREVTGRASRRPIASTILIMLILSLVYFAWLNVPSKNVVATNGLRATPEKFTWEPTVETSKNAKLLMYADENCQGEVIASIEQGVSDVLDSGLYGLCDTVAFNSMRLTGAPEADFYSSCSVKNTYIGTLFASEGCVRKYSYPVAKSFEFVTQSSLEKTQIPASTLMKQWSLQDHQPVNVGIPKARIVFSCESSEYFGYQVWANYYGFLTSQQRSASWTRLLTSRKRDDLSDVVEGLATFQAKRGLYSRRYSPINKPDVIAKWFESADRPQEPVIVVIDPDNWLLKDVSQYVEQVSPGQAIGEPAYYHGSRTAQKLWKELCRNNCHLDLDLVGVPYVVHRDDLSQIAPLWRSYTIMIKDLNDKDPSFKEKYGHLDLSWAAEMFGYNMASAHVGVTHKVVRRIQVRDVDGDHSKQNLKDVSMIHVGRAWFPKDEPSAAQWAHTEGKSFSHFGQQVWCKCNFTASTIQPWPVPASADFQSTKTLELMHYSKQRFGEIPRNSEFRFGPTRHGYGQSLD